LSVCLTAQDTSNLSAEIVPIIQPASNQKIQPFSGSARFLSQCGYTDICSVQVELTAMMSLDSTQQIRLTGLQQYMFDIAPDTVTWEAPIDSGATFSAIFAFRAQEVGSFSFVLGRRVGLWWQTLASLLLAINENGRPIYAGPSGGSQLTKVDPHPHRSEDTLVLHFHRKEGLGDAPASRDFTAVFKISPPPGRGATSTVDFVLECHTPFYTDVQFALEHTPNLVPSQLP
jgi:hypothetical protein